MAGLALEHEPSPGPATHEIRWNQIRVMCMKLLKTLAVCALAFGAMLSSSSAGAGVITFDGLSGGNGTAFTTYVEGDFTVTPTMGAFFQAQAFGNPTPSIYGGPVGAPTPSTIEVTDQATGRFTFSGVDLTSNSAAGTTYTIEGFLNNAQVLTQSVTIDQINAFISVASVDSSQALDRLTILGTPAQGVTSFNIDNIGVTSIPAGVPEPSALLLSLGGAGGLLAFHAVARRRRRGA